MRTLLFAMALLLTGCKSHLLFTEGSHMGLKLNFRATQTSPAEIDLGYRRGMLAIIPRQDSGDSETTQPLVDESDGQVVIQQDGQEVMSLYSRFKANVGFNDPVEVRHFLATGNAAILLMSRKDQLGSFTEEWNEDPDHEDSEDDELSGDEP